MKTFNPFYIFLLLLLPGLTLAQQPDRAPQALHGLEQSIALPNPNLPEAMWDLEFNYQADDSLGQPSLAGAIYVNGEFWISQWNSDQLFRLNQQGQAIDTFTIPQGLGGNLSGTRAFSYDGNGVFIANNSTTIFQIAPTTRTISSSFTTQALSGGAGIRFLTYDPTADNNNGGFWVGNFNTELRLISRSGATLQNIPQSVHGLGGMYGAAYDGQSPGGPYLWVFHQSGGPSSGTISQISLDKGGIPTGEVRDVAMDLTMDPTQLAGGLSITDELYLNKRTIVGMLQSGNLFGYDLDFVAYSHDAVALDVYVTPRYTQMPERFVNTLNAFEGTVFNQGTTDPDNIEVSISVDSAGTTIFSGASTTVSNVATYDSASFSIMGSFTPLGQATYGITATAEAAGGNEEDPSDGTAVYNYTVTDSIMARDDGIATATYRFNAQGYAGALFTMPVDGYLKAIEVELADVPTQVGDTIYAIMAPANGGVPDNNLAITGPPQIVQAGQSTYYLPLTVNFPVQPNSTWLVGIYKSDSIALAASSFNYEQGFNFFSGTPVSWLPSGVANTRFIRPIIASCSIFGVDLSSTPDNGTNNGTVSANIFNSSGLTFYLWDDPNASTTQTVTGLAAGTYQVTVGDANGCSTTDTVVVGSNVSIDDQLQAGISQLEVFPNPSQGQLQVKLDLVKKSAVQLSLLDPTGREVLSEQLNPAFAHASRLDLSSLAPGVYSLKVQTETGSAVKQVVVR